MSVTRNRPGEHAGRARPLHRPAGAPPGRRPELRPAAAAGAPGGPLAAEEPVLRARRGPVLARAPRTAATSAGSARRSTALATDPEVGHFGMIAAEDDPEVFAALFAAAEAWLRARGKQRVLGPLQPVDQRGDGPARRRLRHAADAADGPRPAPCRAAHRGARLRQGQGRDRLPPRHRARAARRRCGACIAGRSRDDDGAQPRHEALPGRVRHGHRRSSTTPGRRTGASSPSPRPRSRTWPRA